MFRWLSSKPASPPAPPAWTEADLLRLLVHINPDGRPNVHPLRQALNNIDPLSLNVKQMGYRLARQLAEALPPLEKTEPRRVNVQSSLSTQGAIESDWAAHWCHELRIPVLYHRKVWELCFVMQALYDADLIRPGSRGLGFGCGSEPLPSYFAANGIDITATDLRPEDALNKGWMETGQHASEPEHIFMAHLVDREAFDRHVQLRHVDMTAIPADLTGYDFCWSICALEHLGSLEKGLAFIENSIGTLRPGGLSIHTTEFNINEDGPTIDHWSAVAYQRHHLETLAAKLEAQGHHVSPFDFSLGGGVLDQFVDIPPFHHDLSQQMQDWLGFPAHLKLAFEGIIVTCVGLIVRKGG